jgi:Ribbon-helix-helix protein, copG family
MASTKKMHQTTVRFGADLWDALDRECAELGVSVAQFVREAALARLMYMAGRRGDLDFERALESSRPHASGSSSGVLERSAAEVSASSALWAQGKQARRRAQELRGESERRRVSR